MVFLNNISKHKQWRKVAKKMRRKSLRQTQAQERDQKIMEEQQRRENSPGYQQWIKEQEYLENLREAEELKQRQMRQLEWQKVEREAQIQWQQLQIKLAIAREEKAKQNMKIKLEWEQEQKKLKEQLEKKEKEMEERRLLQEKQEKDIQEFLENGDSTPDHLKDLIESNPGKSLCPFFQKTGACRFFDSCSRNHVRPSISKIILIRNFYSHYSLEKTMENEHGSDASLEYESEEMFLHYKEFFNDVVSEMEKMGKIRNFKTCCNHELHLRGNVYVEYSTTREALVSYRTFNRRWYGGRQLNVEFCNISSWKMAVCGLFYSKRCPKGNSCNFLHVFRNPQNLYTVREEDSIRSYKSHRSYRDRDRNNKWDDSDDESSSMRNWRWSQSPERMDSRSDKINGNYKQSSERRARKRFNSRTIKRSSSRSMSPQNSYRSTRRKRKSRRNRSTSSSESRSSRSTKSSSRSHKSKLSEKHKKSRRKSINRGVSRTRGSSSSGSS